MIHILTCNVMEVQRHGDVGRQEPRSARRQARRQGQGVRRSRVWQVGELAEGARGRPGDTYNIKCGSCNLLFNFYNQGSSVMVVTIKDLELLGLNALISLYNRIACVCIKENHGIINMWLMKLICMALHVSQCWCICLWLFHE